MTPDCEREQFVCVQTAAEHRSCFPTTRRVGVKCVCVEALALESLHAVTMHRLSWAGSTRQSRPLRAAFVLVIALTVSRAGSTRTGLTRTKIHQ